MDKQISKCMTPLVLWVACLVGVLICGVMFWGLGQAEDLPAIALLAYPVVGLVGLTALYELFGSPLTFASISPDGSVTFTWRYLLYSQRKVFPAAALAEPKLVEYVDSDGDSHWSVRLVLPDGSEFVIAEYGVSGGAKNEKTRQRCEARRTQFIDGLSR